ncbi:MAG: metallophosphoesterase family protein [Armatimonadota bacterium]|nr:metallophosphoesterase family protein [bacterium]MDW8321463.1 metallophosphoesterase family protein [Armatimonadota bacterium]
MHQRFALLRAGMTVTVLLATLSLGLSVRSGVQQQQTSPQPSPLPCIQPSAYPDRIILTWSDNPATTQSVTWRTDTSVRKAVAQIALAGDRPDFHQAAQTQEARTTPLQTDQGVAHYHSVTFRRLKPDTLYAYRVGDGVHWSEWIQFRTASDRPQPFTFLFLGDAQNDIRNACLRVVRQAFLKHPDIRFVIHAGDLVNRGERDVEWAEWFAMMDWMAASVPSIPTPGNHEYVRDAEDKRFLTTHWRAQFTLPENGIPALKESNYYVDFQGVRIISLNCMEHLQRQAQWLERVLEDNPNHWTIVTFHFPVFSSAQGRDNPQLRALLKPILDRYRVDLVLSGHDHTYARSVPQQGGTVYVNSVTGPKMYKLNQQPWMRRWAQDTQFYHIVHVDGDRLLFESYTAAGKLFDAFEIRKRRGQVNQVIDRIPSRT